MTSDHFRNRESEPAAKARHDDAPEVWESVYGAQSGADALVRRQRAAQCCVVWERDEPWSESAAMGESSLSYG